MDNVDRANNSMIGETPGTPVMVPHTPEGTPPETKIAMVVPPPIPPRREKTITIHLDSALTANFIQMMSSHPEEFEWKGRSRPHL